MVAYALGLYSSNATFLIFMQTVANASITLKIMLGFHRNNHKPTTQTNRGTMWHDLRHMSDMSPHFYAIATIGGSKMMQASWAAA